jgi:hypothetical protein
VTKRTTQDAVLFLDTTDPRLGRLRASFGAFVLLKEIEQCNVSSIINQIRSKRMSGWICPATSLLD